LKATQAAKIHIILRKVSKYNFYLEDSLRTVQREFKESLFAGYLEEG
jgi:hypothetical protein